jgi:hypothetical protein
MTLSWETITVFCSDEESLSLSTISQQGDTRVLLTVCMHLMDSSETHYF